MIKVNDKSMDFVGMIFWAACCLYLVQYLMGCGSMQGGRFCIGMEGFNGASENKTFIKDVEKK